MNKKKSKALAFLLAASLLVPSTNGIVSAAELNASTDKVLEDSVVVDSNNLESNKVVESGKTGENWGADYETATTFTINSLEELKAFRDLVNGGKNFKGKTVNLNSSIDLNSEEWTPIGNGSRLSNIISGRSFQGTFNGNGNTISNLKITSGVESSLIGFFGGLSGATVKNINFEKIEISSLSENVGTLAGVVIGNSTISGINVKSGKLSASNASGVIGRLMIEGTIESCTNAADVTASTGGGSVAGIVSKAYYTRKDKEMNIINCTNTGTIEGKYAAGGIVGLSAANVKGCINNANITGPTSGGIIGEQLRYGTIESNTNTGNISGSNPVGGIVGWVRYYEKDTSYQLTDKITIKNNKNSGEIISKQVGTSLACAGGIVGNIYNAGYVYNNENTANKIEGTVFAAGVVGALQPEENDNKFNGKEKDIRVYDNISKTLDDNIVGKNKHLYVYNNDTKGEYTKVENNMSEAVATVNGKNYGTLELAIKAAMSGENKTVKLLSDIKADTWNQIWNIKGITLDGNGKTIKVKKIESLENHDAVLHSAGGNTFKNLTIDLSEVEKGKAQGIRAISASTGDVIDNVTIIGGKNASYGITAGSSCKNLTVKNSNISNCGHGVYLEGANDATVLIKDNTFDGCEYASILYSKNATFEGNTVKGGKVNIMHESNVVQKNTFTQDNDGKASRVKFYTKGNEKTFKYNKLVEGKDGKIGSTITFATGKNPVNPVDVDFSLNYLGDKDKFDEIIEGATSEEIVGIKDQAFNEPSDVDKYLNGGSSTPSIPSKPIKPTYDHTSIIGSDRYDTAGKIADKLGSYNTAVLVNATTTMSDGLSAAGLAGKEDAAILLTKKDSIPKATMDRLKKVKKVYIIGGENAISQKVVNEITKNVAKVEIERLGGKTRVETSELVAKEIGNYKKAFVVNGFKGEADAMSASAVAAREESPILLTNGKTSTHAKKSDVKYYVVGGKNVMNNVIADKYNAEIIAGDDRYETNREMVNEFYGASEILYFVNGEILVDALTASTIAKDDGLVLVGRKSDNKILNRKNTIQVGGMNFDVDFEK